MSQAERRKFDADDGYVQTITTGGLATPRSIAFAPIAGESVPAMSEWRLIAIALSLATAGTLIARPRRKCNA